MSVIKQKQGASEKKQSNSPLEKVTLVYQAKGWTVINVPKGSIVDIITSNGKRMHFVKVVHSTKLDSKTYQGIAKNTFIQNAFSNGAVPVYAVIYDDCIKFTDVNIGSTVYIGSGKSKPILK